MATQKSYGVRRNSVSVGEIEEALVKIKDYQRLSMIGKTYDAKIADNVPCLKHLLDKDLVEDIAIELGLIDIKLRAVELHIRKSNGSKIPWHQDNFYHCIQPANGFKVLLPFHKLNKDNGALSYVDHPRDIKVFRHCPRI